MRMLKKSFVAGMMMAMLVLQMCFPFVQSLANETVDVHVLPCPVIDIVLAKSKTKVDVNQFEADLKKKLIEQNISSERVKINAVEAVEANIQSSFNWKTDVASSIGSIQITNGGQNIVMKGNKKNPGKNAIWIIPEKQQEQEITFDYSVDFGDSFNSAGMLLRVKQEGNVLSGYMLSLNKSGKGWYTTAGKKYGAIWKFSYQIGTNTKNMTKTFVQGVDIATSGRLNIKSTDNEIVISGGGLKAPITYVMDAEYGHGFGFFSDHYSHNCSKIGAFTLGNIKLTTTTVKKFKEVLSNPEWRENSLRFLVNVDDYENEELKDKAQFASLQTRLMNEQIHPIFWGTDKNETQLKEVIQSNNGNGVFVPNADYVKAIETTAQYIKSLVEASKSLQYALIGEPVELKVTPESAKTNTITPSYPQGKWKVNHDYEYFENNLGQFQESGKYLSDLEVAFDKTGRYELLYEDGAIASKYIYVHRKPVANFSVLQEGNNVTLTSQSYDLDNYSNNRGITAEEWKYKKVGETNWTEGKLTQIEPNEVFVVQLKVKDFQETWSAPSTKYVMVSNENANVAPVASFHIKNTTLSKYEELQLEDSSYDPAGAKLTDSVWKVKKDGNLLYTGKAPLTNYHDYETGNYTVSLMVTNEFGKVSEEFSRIFQLVDDTSAPEAILTPTSSDWTNQPVNVQLNFTDKGGSKFKGYQYVITDSTETPSSWSDVISKENDVITIQTEGEKYLHVIAQDNAGNVSRDRVSGPYKIDLSKPEVESIVPEKKDWTKDSIDIHVTFADKGGSGFAGYQYAITTDQQAPEAWSERVKEEKATFTISGEAQSYLHIRSYDQAGNVSAENVYGSYQVDKTSPEVSVTPTFSDWTNQPINVAVQVADEGGSLVQNYRYAITDSGVMPEEWTKEVTGTPEPILLDTEGEKYLHIVGKDNAGNESPDAIFGKYKLDFTLPELVSDQNVASAEKLSSIKFTAMDKLSGVSKFSVNGTDVEGTEYVATKNGAYQFQIVDKAGNVLTKELTLNNLYRQCDKNLGHPDFSTSHEKCPICALVDEIKITKAEKVYTGKPLGISYEKPKGATITEYYNNQPNQPLRTGQYNYELKMVYEGEEYATGIKSVFTVEPKEVEVVDLKLEDKIEDGKTEVKIDQSNVKIEGMVEEDKKYVALEVADIAQFDNVEAGEKTVVLQKDEDYFLKLKENVDKTYEEVIMCYQLPDTITLTGQIIAKETTEIPENKEDNSASKSEEPQPTENEKTDLQENTDKNTAPKRVKSKIAGKLLYTGRTVGGSLVVVAAIVVGFQIFSGKMLIKTNRRKPRILEKVTKK